MPGHHADCSAFPESFEALGQASAGYETGETKSNRSCVTGRRKRSMVTPSSDDPMQSLIGSEYLLAWEAKREAQTPIRSVLAERFGRLIRLSSRIKFGDFSDLEALNFSPELLELPTIVRAMCRGIARAWAGRLFKPPLLNAWARVGEAIVRPGACNRREIALRRIHSSALETCGCGCPSWR